MKSLIALSALVALAAAQAESFSFGSVETEPATSVGNVEPTATETTTGPINTARACAQISSLVGDSFSRYPVVGAELAYACLKSVPISATAASRTIDSLKIMVQMQSTLKYLKDPPSGYINKGVDIVGGLDNIGRKVENGDYDNEYDFEADIAALLVKAHDGHLGFDGMAFGGVFMWRRSREISLISASDDGKAPKIWAIHDFNSTEDGSKRSAVTKINGKDAVEFLEEESLQNSYHDPDVRYNAMFYMSAAQNAGYFANPTFYPGPSMEVTFENGTTETFPNSALVLDATEWDNVDDGDSFYDTFIDLSSSSARLAKRGETHNLPRHLQLLQKAELDDDTAIVPPTYPEPAIEHSASDVPLAGYFIETGAGTVGVLMVQTFNTESVNDAEEFQDAIEDYIKEAKSRNVAKHVIDVRANGGGLVMLGYDMYLQFFPSQEPQLLSRYRGNDATNLIGSKLSELELNSLTVQAYGTPFNDDSYLDKDLKKFGSWENMYGPTTFHDDEFTNLLRYNLSDPLVTSSDRFSVGITMTGYGDRSHFTKDPFKKEDIVILTDGICASTCSLFTELMVQQSGVKTLAVGGRPSLGPMQAVGGTKGSLVLRLPLLQALSTYVVQNFASSNSEAREWVEKLPFYRGVNFVDGSINFQDNIRKGLERDGIPTQFLNDSASCRIWYAPEDYLNVTNLWSKAAEVAFGKDGELDEDACLAGSVTTLKAQQGLGEGSPTSPEGTADPTKSKGAAAMGYTPAKGGWAAVVVCTTVVLSSMLFGASLI